MHIITAKQCIILLCCTSLCHQLVKYQLILTAHTICIQRSEYVIGNALTQGTDVMKEKCYFF